MRSFLILSLVSGVYAMSYAQRTVFDLFKSDKTLTNEHIDRGELKEAIRLAERRRSPDSHLIIARSNYLLKEYQKSLLAYDLYLATGKKLTPDDSRAYAETCVTLKKYEQALVAFQRVLEAEPTSQEVLRKVWRISNLSYLYEDSVHYATRLLTINTAHGEWGAVPFGDALVYLSNRPPANPVKKIDAATHQSFYRMFSTNEKPDTLLEGWGKLYGKPALYAAGPSVTGNAAGFHIYGNGLKMIFTASANERNSKGVRNLGLYFAELQGGNWKVVRSFEHNSATWSVANPAFDTVQNVLYFASDKPGGYGRMDLYQSKLTNGRWTEPVNLGEGINTSGDEIFPYYHQGTLYFSSTGQPGIGGLDIFRTYITSKQIDEPVNLGYPINSSYDDFSISFTDNKGNHGFFSSNRKQGGLDDDIYEFDMDMQTYPFEITGVIKQMDHSWNKDSIKSHTLKNAKIILVDNIRNIIVQETNSDESGAFSLHIPYFSKYAVRVTDSDGVENIVVFEIPRQRKESTVHEIVIIKDIFQSLTR
jgi:tetratricopeptide (TPR) repeat protein